MSRYRAFAVQAIDKSCAYDLR